MREHDFKLGDVVCLKSGSEKMTIAYVSSDGRAIKCQWMDGKELRSETFAPEMLEHVPEGEDDLPDIPSYPDD